MIIDNFTNSEFSYNVGLEKSGKSILVLVCKSTYIFEETECSKLIPLEKQLPPQDVDLYRGDPKCSSLLYENDFAPLKNKCDILVNAYAYSQGNDATKEMLVGLVAPGVNKWIRVYGERRFHTINKVISLSEPVPFEKKEICYENAFGGGHKEDSDYYIKNPVGTGYCLKIKKINGTILPSQEYAGEKIVDTVKHYTPVSFGPVARSWQPRLSKAGTYDKSWMENRAPYLPVDFCESFYQSAPEDQQVDNLDFGDEIAIYGMTKAPKVSFKVPETKMAIKIQLKNGTDKNLIPKLDTVFIDAEKKQVSFVFRTHLNIKKSIVEFDRCIIGTPSKAWERCQMTGKKYISLKGENVFGKSCQNCS